MCIKCNGNGEVTVPRWKFEDYIATEFMREAMDDKGRVYVEFKPNKRPEIKAAVKQWKERGTIPCGECK